MQNSRVYQAIIGILVLGIATFFLLTDNAEPLPEEAVPDVELDVVETNAAIIGTSVEGREIEAWQFGTGETNLLFVGGIHGGYEWNTVLLANEMITYFEENESNIPDNLTIHIIPNLNPDGVVTALGTSSVASSEAALAVAPTAVADGRFNANGVDLNRNFDCRWSPEGVWRGTAVGTGDGPFSEPESAALRDYVRMINPAAAVFWHSRANNVYGSECGEAVSAETLALMNTYATAGDYGAVPVFDAYVVRGAAEDWLASLGIPTVSVELETRTSSEYDRNLAGTLATLELYAQ
jgi:hypothetical protein